MSLNMSVLVSEVEVINLLSPIVCLSVSSFVFHFVQLYLGATYREHSDVKINKNSTS